MLDHFFFFFKQKTAYEIRKGDWSSDVCSSDLELLPRCPLPGRRKAIVDEQQLRVRRPQQRRRVLVAIAHQPVPVDRLLPRLAAEERRELPNCPPIRNPGRDVRP